MYQIHLQGFFFHFDENLLDFNKNIESINDLYNLLSILLPKPESSHHIFYMFLHKFYPNLFNLYYY
jgi:hypothetical protein